MRRGKKGCEHVVWGNSASVLVGDFLFARSFNLMVETGDIQVLDILARAASVIAEGEVMQLAAANDAETTRERYMADRGGEDGGLFAAAAKFRRGGCWAAGRGSDGAGYVWPRTRAGVSACRRCARLWRPRRNHGQECRATISAKAKSHCRWCSRAMRAMRAERAFWRRVVGGERTDDDFHRALGAIEAAQRHWPNARRRARARSRRRKRSARDAAGERLSRSAGGSAGIRGRARVLNAFDAAAAAKRRTNGEDHNTARNASIRLARYPRGDARIIATARKPMPPQPAIAAQ